MGRLDDESIWKNAGRLTKIARPFIRTKSPYHLRENFSVFGDVVGRVCVDVRGWVGRWRVFVCGCS
jgi:hypothetical protein